MPGLLAPLLAVLACAGIANAQVPPTVGEIEGYRGFFAAAAKGDVTAIRKLASKKNAKVDARDGKGRTPLIVAAFAGQRDAMRALVAAGANPNALDDDRYDMVTIAAVADDLPTLETALALGNKATNITSRYDGTALIAAAHLGHAEVVRKLVIAGAPLDHVNNLGWTAVIESIVLGDGGPRHTETLVALIEGGANLNIADRSGTTPLHLAQAHGFREMAKIIEAAGGR